jgi:hypothetical protein
MSDETTTEPATNVEAPEVPDLKSLIANLPNAPDQATIDAWKAKFGNVFVSGFDESEIYIWRALTRAEYKQIQIEQQIQTVMNQLGEKPNEKEVTDKITNAINSDFAREEKTVSQCLLWPKLSPEELSQKAGTVPSLLEQITANSNFLTPAQASMLVLKL